MAEAGDLQLAREPILGPGAHGHRPRIRDRPEHAQHFFVRAAVQRPGQRADRGRHHRVRVGQRRPGHARGERRRVHLVLGVQDQRDVHRVRDQRLGLLAGQDVEEVRGMAEVGMALDRIVAVADALPGRDDRRQLGDQADDAVVAELRVVHVVARIEHARRATAAPSASIGWPLSGSVLSRSMMRNLTLRDFRRSASKRLSCACVGSCRTRASTRPLRTCCARDSSRSDSRGTAACRCCRRGNRRSTRPLGRWPGPVRSHVLPSCCAPTKAIQAIWLTLLGCSQAQQEEIAARLPAKRARSAALRRASFAQPLRSFAETRGRSGRSSHRSGSPPVVGRELEVGLGDGDAAAGA